MAIKSAAVPIVVVLCSMMAAVTALGVKVLWVNDYGSGFASGPAVDSTSGTVYFSRGAVHAVAIETGAHVGHAYTGGMALSALNIANNTLLFTGGLSITALSLRSDGGLNPTPLWRYTYGTHGPGTVFCSSRVPATDNTVVMGYWIYNVSAIGVDLTTGALRWHIKYPNAENFACMTADAYGVAYFALQHTVMAYHAKSGALKWNVTLANVYDAQRSLVVSEDGGYVFVVVKYGEQPYVAVLDAHTGKHLRTMVSRVRELELVSVGRSSVVAYADFEEYSPSIQMIDGDTQSVRWVFSPPTYCKPVMYKEFFLTCTKHHFVVLHALTGHVELRANATISFTGGRIAVDHVRRIAVVQSGERHALAFQLLA